MSGLNWESAILYRFCRECSLNLSRLFLSDEAAEIQAIVSDTQ